MLLFSALLLYNNGFLPQLSTCIHIYVIIGKLRKWRTGYGGVQNCAHAWELEAVVEELADRFDLLLPVCILYIEMN